MKKSTLYFNIFSPHYVLLSGTVGIFIALALFIWNYPQKGDTIGQAFVATKPFLVWVFLFLLLCCLLTTFILPAWGMLVYLIKNRIYVNDPGQRRIAVLMIVLQAIFLAVIVSMLLQFTTSSGTVGFNFDAWVPKGHNARMMLMYAFTFLTVLPALLGMSLIHSGARELFQKIQDAAGTESELFPLMDELFFYRSLLQNYLSISGLIFSMIPITTAGLRAIFIALDASNEQNFPINNVIIFGLIFTLILLLIYIPSHVALTETSRSLRDALCPLHSLEMLKEDTEHRKLLDDLLQTNLSVTQNLKTGLIALAPLATSLLSSVLNIKIPL